MNPKATIIIIEDNPELIYLLRRFVENSGYRAVVTTQGETAVSLAQQETPLMIMIESQLAELNGCQALEALHQNVSTQDIPIVLYSNSSEKRCHSNQGVIGYLQQPLLYQDFMILLDKSLCLQQERHKEGASY